MKDKGARGMIRLIARKVGIGVEFKGERPCLGGDNFLYRAESVMRELGDISIKDCPVCKHPVMAVQCHVKPGISSLQFTPTDWLPSNIYRCLTCGSKFTCSEKCVCELVKDE